MSNQNTVKQRRSTYVGFSIISIILAGVSVNFFIMGSLGIVPFVDYRDEFLVPSILGIVAIAVYSRSRIKPLSNRLLTGLWAGAMATVALEAIRIPSLMIFHWL